jgi:hypothetical protein
MNGHMVIKYLDHKLAVEMSVCVRSSPPPPTLLLGGHIQYVFFDDVYISSLATSFLPCSIQISIQIHSP